MTIGISKTDNKIFILADNEKALTRDHGLTYYCMVDTDSVDGWEEVDEEEAMNSFNQFSLEDKSEAYDILVGGAE